MRAADVGERLRWFAEQVDASTAPTPSGDWHNLCLMLARTGAGVPGKYAQADIAAAHTRYRTEPQAAPPPGWLVWYDRGPQSGAASDADAGHVITSAGNGLGYSNDVRRRGRVDLVRLTEPVTAWGYRRVCDSRDVNDVIVVSVDTRVPPGHPPAEHTPLPAGHLFAVASGDTVSGLVAAHAPAGVAWADVWRDPHNLALRKLRGRPELIRPGDHVWVP